MPEVPKLSQIARSFAVVEDSFESMATQMGIPVPQGPMKTAVALMEQFEETVPAPEAFPALPELPMLPEFTLPFQGFPMTAGTIGTGEVEKYPLETEKTKVEEVTKSSGESAGGFLLVKD